MTPDYDPRLAYADRIGLFAGLVKEPHLRALYLRAMHSVDWQRIEAIREKHAVALANYNPGSKLKYLDVPFWTWLRLNEIKNIGLDQAEPLRILDLGCGCAHFALLVQALGHTYVGTDIDEPFYEDMCRAFNINRVPHRISRQEALPDFGGPFDLVTAFDISFNYVKAVRDEHAFEGVSWLYFSAQDWTNLLADLCSQMNLCGRIYFIPNTQRRDDGSSVHEPELVQHFDELGAKPQVKYRSIIFDLAIREVLTAGNKGDRQQSAHKQAALRS